jgi:hypothetical protein
MNMWGEPYINPITGEETKFCVPGDPAEKTGWFCGEGWPDGPPPKDIYYLMSSGPFTLAPGDTQEVVIAIMITKGTDRKNSVTKLKGLAAEVREWYYNDYVTDVKSNELLGTPTNFELKQNYPNPFNPTTTLEYSLPVSSKQSAVGSWQRSENRYQNSENQNQNQASGIQYLESSIQVHSFNQPITQSGTGGLLSVKLVVYDILGREVATLVNEQQKPGSYSVAFDAGYLSSGVYFYKLQTDSFVKTRKMILLK